MKILVPTDFSENATHAIKYASLFANAISAELLLLHVYTPAVTRGNVAYPLITEEIARMVGEASEKLHDIASAFSEEYGIRCEYRVRTGTPVGEIVSEAEDSESGLIVMGTLGASGIGGVLFGSNTASVIEKANCPVLAVPANSTVALPRRIVFATDYGDNDITTLEELVTLAKPLNAEFILLHVSKRSDLEAEQILIEEYSKAVAMELDIDQLFYYVMQHEHTQEGIGQFADSIGAHLITLSMRKRGIFERWFDSSLSKGLANEARFPLLVFHLAPDKSEEMPDDDA